MNNGAENTIHRFLSALNITSAKGMIPLGNYDITYVTDWDLYDLLRDEVMKQCKKRKSNSEFIKLLGDRLTAQLNHGDRVFIFLYLLENIYSVSSWVPEDKKQKVISKAGSALGFNPEVQKEIAGFFLNMIPLSDAVNSVYFLNKNSKTGFKTICRNVLHHDNEGITYVKYCSGLNIILSKTYRKNNTSLFNEGIFVTDFRIITEHNFNRADYAYYSFNELVEVITDHNPLKTYEFKTTNNLPYLKLDPTNGTMIISGNSFPLSSSNCFAPILEWLAIYKKANKQYIHIDIELDNFNTYTSKFLVHLIKECKSMSKEGFDIKFKIHYDQEDEDMKEFGIGMQRLFGNGASVKLCPRAIELVS